MSEESAAKKAKTEDAPELEVDAPAEKGAKVKELTTFHSQDTTMNCIPSSHGGMLMPLADGGLQYLLAGARGSIGLKQGRYMFEAKILDVMNQAEDQAAKAKVPGSRSQLLVGFSTAGSSLFVGDSEDSIGFDNEGSFISNKSKTKPSQRFGSGDVIALVLNLDATNSMENANTVSLFKNGKRACQPQELPDALKGKPLFPAFTFKNLKFHFNFGPTPLVSLPFKCRMVNEASVKDVTFAEVKKPKGGKYDVLFPVCLPDEGASDWLEAFLEENKDYTDLTERAIQDWAAKSGIARTATGTGIPLLDDGSVRQVLQKVAPIQKRNYVLMDVKANLISDERKELFAKWKSCGFKRTAAVMMGEPPKAFINRSQEMMLKIKQESSDKAFRAKQAEEKKKKLLERAKKQREKERLKAQKLAKKKADDLKKKIDIQKKKKEAEAKGEEFEEPEEEEQIEEPEEEAEEEDEEMPEAEPPKVKLTAEELKQWFSKPSTPDMSAYQLNTSFTKFSVPEKEEGLDDIKFEWQTGDKCKEYVKQWVGERKMTTRIEDITPSDWFTTKWKEWQKTLQSFKQKQTAYKTALTKKASDKANKAKAKEARIQAKEAAAKKREAMNKRKREVAEKKLEEETKKMEDALAKGEEYVPAEIEMPMEEDAAPEQEEEEAEGADEEAADFDNVDVFGVEDFLNIGAGEPLFSRFAFEDWTLMSLRFELHLLCHAFRKDVNDTDRPGMVLEHFPFYYQKYFKKAFNTKTYGLETVKEVVDLLRDCVLVTGKNDVVDPRLPDELESHGIFVMITEEARRHRHMKIDAGDESAKLKITQPGAAAAGAAATGALRPAASAAGVAVKPPVKPPVRPTATADMMGGGMMMDEGMMAGAGMMMGGGAMGGGGGGKGGGGKGGGGKGKPPPPPGGCKWCKMGECWTHAGGIGGGAM